MQQNLLAIYNDAERSFGHVNILVLMLLEHAVFKITFS